MYIVCTKKTEKKKHVKEFSFTGIMRCKKCGHVITAEHKINRYGSEYVYYHCSKRNKKGGCRQPSIEVKDLEKQIDKVLRTVNIREEYLKVALEELSEMKKITATDNNIILDSIDKSIKGNEQKLKDLLDMKLDGMLTNDEYTKKKNELLFESETLESKLKKNESKEKKLVKHTEDAFDFITHARIWLKKGDKFKKKKMLLGICSNPFLEDRKLLTLLPNYLEYIRKKTKPYRDENGVFEPSVVNLNKTKTRSTDPALSTMQELKESNLHYRFWRPTFYR